MDYSYSFSPEGGRFISSSKGELLYEIEGEKLEVEFRISGRGQFRYMLRGKVVVGDLVKVAEFFKGEVPVPKNYVTFIHNIVDEEYVEEMLYAFSEGVTRIIKKQEKFFMGDNETQAQVSFDLIWLLVRKILAMGVVRDEVNTFLDGFSVEDLGL